MNNESTEPLTEPATRGKRTLAGLPRRAGTEGKGNPPRLGISVTPRSVRCSKSSVSKYKMPMNITKAIFSPMQHPVLLLTLACLLTVPATAQVNYAVSGGTAYVTSSPNASGDIVIASTYNGYPV